MANKQLDIFNEPTNRTRKNDYDTSNQGAADVSFRAKSQKCKLLFAFAKEACRKNKGLTDEEASNAAGLPERCCFWKRCGELRDLGLIEFTSEMRMGGLGSQCGVSKITLEGMRLAVELGGK
jgi:hypothetical protein